MAAKKQGSLSTAFNCKKGLKITKKEIPNRNIGLSFDLFTVLATMIWFSLTLLTKPSILPYNAKKKVSRFKPLSSLKIYPYFSPINHYHDVNTILTPFVKRVSPSSLVGISPGINSCLCS